MYRSLIVPLLILSVYGLALGGPVSAALQRRDCATAVQIRQELGPQLSPNAVIIDAENGDFGLATERWTAYDQPTFASVIEVADVDDIVTTIEYAKKNSIPFLAKGGAHGAIKGMEDFKNGIQISLSRLNSITVHSNNTATIQGGAKNHEVTEALWKAQKQTVTGICECTGFLGPALGGGHGFLQGRYGLAVDNFLAARVLLSNGTLVSVSPTERPDLWWALRGAGHNFGIVTEIDYKVYDVPKNDEWSYESWIFDQSSLESVFTTLNLFRKTMPAEAVGYSLYLRERSIDPVNPVIFVAIAFNGSPLKAAPYFAPFRALKPLSTTSQVVPFDKLAVATGADLNGPQCSYGGVNRVRAGLYLNEFNVRSQREAFRLYNATTAAIPAFNQSVVAFDVFSTKGTSRVPVASTAMPWRRQPILLAPITTYMPDPSLDVAAEKLASEIRDILSRGSGIGEMRTYINYAFGNETLQQLYGSERWRVDKLKSLKRQYDPANDFRFYGPPGGFGT